MSHTSVIASGSPFNTGTYTVTRTAAPTFTNGEAVAGAVTTLTDVPMSIQPIARRMQAPAEGESLVATDTIFTQTELKPRTTTYEGDVVTQDGESYRVIACVRWQAFGETHYVAQAARQVIP